MKTISKKNLFLTSILTMTFVSVTATSGFAQENNDEVVVTGSLIPRDSNFTSTSPVTTVTDLEFKARGVVKVEDMINTLPQAFGAQGSNLANGATGLSSLDLRGLGSNRNLVLLNGRRLPYGSTNAASTDVNFIPSSLIKKVEILTGGASTAYGSDAISGVANFILDTDFEGVRIDSNYSVYQHNNKNKEMAKLLGENAAKNPTQFTVPTGSHWGGETFDITASFGGSINDGKGHAMAYAGYQDTKALMQADRDYSQCSLGTTGKDGKDFSCGGSSTNQVANLLDLTDGYDFGTGSVWARVNPEDGTIAARNFTTDTFNYNPYNFYQRPNKRYNFGAFANYDVAENTNAYTEIMFMQNHTNVQIAPSGIFGLGVTGENGGINCNNVFLSDAQRQTLCGANGLGVDDIAPALILRRNVEGGNRNEDITNTTFRGLFGLKGGIGETNFSYDVSASYSAVSRSSVYNNDLSKKKVAKALYAVADPKTGKPVCFVNIDEDPTNDDAACVPYDIWSSAGPSKEAVNYLSNPLLRSGRVSQGVIKGIVHGTVESLKFPTAGIAPSIAFGAEYRIDKLKDTPDSNYQSNDGAGQGGATLPIEGEQDVFDFFAEVNLPLVQDRAGIEDLSLDLAYRHSIYDKGSAGAYKIAAEYAPVSDIRFRGSYQRAVRAPNIFELFKTQSFGLFDLTSGANGLYDPCAGPTPEATAAQCANTGVTAAQYGNIADNPAGQFNNLTGGNPDLKPETANTITLGFVATPNMIEGLTVSFDYFDIKVNDFIGTVPENLTMKQCIKTGAEFFCSLINRGNGGTLWANSTGYIKATNINTGELATTGFDILANYAYDLDNFGSLNFEYVSTFLTKHETKPLPTSGKEEIYDCVGYYGGSCGAPTPKYRHKANIRWATANEKLGVNFAWRYYGSVRVSQASKQEALNGKFSKRNARLGAQNYFDLSGSYALRDNVNLRFGVNNILDREPPLSSLAGTAPGNGNTYPQVYDALGRKFFMGATVDF